MKCPICKCKVLIDDSNAAVIHYPHCRNKECLGPLLGIVNCKEIFYIGFSHVVNNTLYALRTGNFRDTDFDRTEFEIISKQTSDNKRQMIKINRSFIDEINSIENSKNLIIKLSKYLIII